MRRRTTGESLGLTSVNPAQESFFNEVTRDKLPSKKPLFSRSRPFKKGHLASKNLSEHGLSSGFSCGFWGSSPGVLGFSRTYRPSKRPLGGRAGISPGRFFYDWGVLHSQKKPLKGYKRAKKILFWKGNLKHTPRNLTLTPGGGENPQKYALLHYKREMLREHKKFAKLKRTSF